MKTQSLALLFALSMLCQDIFAQLQFSAGADMSFFGTSDPDLAQDAMKKKLIVVLNEIPEKKIEKLQKKGEYEETKKRIDDENAKLLSMFEKHWQLGNEITPMVDSKYDEFKKTKDPDYLYFRIRTVTDTKQRTVPTGKVTVTYTYKMIEINDLGEKDRVATVTTDGVRLTDLDLKVSLLILQNLITEAAKGVVKKEFEEQINSRAGILKEKTLLIPKHLTKLKQEELQENYPYKIEVVEESRLNELVDSRDKKYVFLTINHKAGSTGTKFNHTIVDMETFNAVLLDKRSDFGFGSFTGAPGTGGPINFYFVYDINAKSHEFVNKGKLKDYVEIISMAK